VPGFRCGTKNGTNDCYKNEQFALHPDGAVTNLISGYCVVEDKDESIALAAPGASGCSTAHAWQYDPKTMLLKSKSSGRCLGRWQNAPPPPPGPPNSHRPRVATEQNIDYLIAWVQGLKEHKNLTVDSLGIGYNEGVYNVTWMKEIRKRLDAAGLESLLTIGTDDCCGGQFGITHAMASDPVLNASIDIIGSHCTGPQNHQANPSEAVLALNKPLWNTEQVCSARARSDAWKQHRAAPRRTLYVGVVGPRVVGPRVVVLHGWAACHSRMQHVPGLACHRRQRCLATVATPRLLLVCFCFLLDGALRSALNVEHLAALGTRSISGSPIPARTSAGSSSRRCSWPRR